MQYMQAADQRDEEEDKGYEASAARPRQDTGQSSLVHAPAPIAQSHT
jgi:hypothetical protein